MFISIIAFIVFLIFLIYTIHIFFPAIVQITVNGILLWIIGTRGYIEIVKEKKEKYYAFGALIAAISLFFYGFRTWRSIWWITFFCLITFIVAQHYILYEEKGIDKKIKAYMRKIKSKLSDMDKK